MRILLVGNYSLDKQSSMLRYANMLHQQMTLCGHAVEVIRPRVVVGKWASQPSLRKWLGNFDKYVVFPLELRRRARDFDVVHICDHSNSMYLPHSAGRPASITCHDLLAIESALDKYPQQPVSLSGKVLQRWIFRHLAAASDVVCVSNHTAQQLGALSARASQRVVVIPNALNPDCMRASEVDVQAVRERNGIAADESYLFHIGAEAWYKNRLGAIRIFHKLLERLDPETRSRLRFVMAGHPFTAETRDFIATHLPLNSVVEVVNPSDKDLWSLYSGAVALLFPSLHEGFGWPIIEAQRCGCPVIVSHRDPMSEIAGAAALYIDPDDESAAAAIIADNLNRIAALKEAGERNVNRFDPVLIAQSYDNFFAKVLRRRQVQI